ncbi:MAG: retropepsin-like aspartic protease [Aeromonas sp.]
MLLVTPSVCLPAKALVDSGSAGNFISPEVQRLNLPKRRCSIDYTIHTIQGRPLDKELIQYQAPTITFRVGCLHSEPITLMVLEGSTAEVVLGLPWIAQHNPVINWRSGEVEKWSFQCLSHCISPVQIPSSPL